MAGRDTRKVLVLDENVLDVMRVEKSLRGAGYSVLRMSTPHGAEAKIEFERPDILLLDITMRRLNLDRLLENLREDDAFEDLIVVLFSDLDAEVLQQYCIENDIHGYYCKSMDVDAIPKFLNNFYEE